MRIRMFRLAAFFVAALVAGTPGARGQAAPDYYFQANGLIGIHRDPDVASNHDGDFAVVWENVELGQGRLLLRYGSPAGIGLEQPYAPPIAAAPAITAPTRVAWLDPTARAIAVAEEPGGVAVLISPVGQDPDPPAISGDFVTWEASDATDGSDQVYWKPFHARRDLVFGVGGHPTSERFPAIASNGSIVVVVWTQGGSLNDIFAQRFQAGGQELGPAFRVNTTVDGNQTFSAVAMDSTGAFVVVWDSSHGAAIRFRLFDAAGVALGDDVAVSDSGSLPDVAVDSAGNFVAAWHAPGTSPGENDVYARTYLRGGEARGPVFRVNPDDPVGYPQFPRVSNQVDARVASDAAGNFVVVWRHDELDHSLIVGGRFHFEMPPFVKGDLDRDGQADLWLESEDDPSMHEVWLMDGTTRLGLPVPVVPASDPGRSVGGVDDFDGDGANDLVFWNPTTKAVEFWLLGGSSGAERQGPPRPLVDPVPLPSPQSGWRLAATGDLDHDGRPDLLWHNTVTLEILGWKMNGIARVDDLVPVPKQNVDPNWRLVQTFDYDNDGNPDLLWQNTDSSKVVQWLMDSEFQRVTGRFINPPSPVALNWKVVAGGDFGAGPTGVDTSDLVWRNDDSGRLVVWFLDTDGNRTDGVYVVPDPIAMTVVGPK